MKLVLKTSVETSVVHHSFIIIYSVTDHGVAQCKSHLCLKKEKKNLHVQAGVKGLIKSD